MEIEKIIANKRKEAKDLAKFPVHSEIASIMKEAMCDELLEEADKLEKSLSGRRIEVETQKPKRNCDRFNSGDSGIDFNNAINEYMRETGGEVFNCCPEHTTSGDFVKWLLTRVEAKKD